jgi:hypothetical protein
MANCEQCGYTLECHAGCGIFCRNDCTDCILWCEPHDHVMVMRREEQGDGARTRVSTTEGLDRPAGAPRYSEDEEFRVCFNQLSRGMLARLLNGMIDRQVRAPEDRAAEKISDCTTTSLRGLAEKYSLIID